MRGISFLTLLRALQARCGVTHPHPPAKPWENVSGKTLPWHSRPCGSRQLGRREQGTEMSRSLKISASGQADAGLGESGLLCRRCLCPILCFVVSGAGVLAQPGERGALTRQDPCRELKEAVLGVILRAGPGVFGAVWLQAAAGPALVSGGSTNRAPASLHAGSPGCCKHRCGLLFLSFFHFSYAKSPRLSLKTQPMKQKPVVSPRCPCPRPCSPPSSQVMLQAEMLAPGGSSAC